MGFKSAISFFLNSISRGSNCLPHPVLLRMGFHTAEATCYLTADLFYLEVVLLPCGGVEEVKVAPHGGSPAVSALRYCSRHSSLLCRMVVIKSNCLAAQRVPSSAAEVSRNKSSMLTFCFHPAAPLSPQLKMYKDDGAVLNYNLKMNNCGC